MATKAAVKAKEVFTQYSKRMCTTVAVFWMCYRVLVTLLIFFRPDISTAYIQLTTGVDTVMIANISVYTGNSISEKAFIAFGKNKLKSENEEAAEEEEKQEKEEEGGNA